MSFATVIDDLFRSYLAAPLGLMREIGVQARLHKLLQDDLNHETCRLQVLVPRRRNIEPLVTSFVIERVQMEVRVTDSEGRGPEKSDIVLLRSTTGASEMPITATRYPNGPFDIVSKIILADVNAVLEVKAACSYDFRERHKFRMDVEKLLQLAEKCSDTEKPDFHFVLIDKSMGVGGDGYGADPIDTRLPVADWHIESDVFLAHQTERNREVFWDRSPKVRLLAEKPKSGCAVHVWQIEHHDGVAVSGPPRLRFAVRM